ncbi:ABC transporter ATP-binding protein [Paenibacillus swuensis]|uniref:ABC transporter ATP-binding protein n=1 Tax=Paenibacillus swuensis TaxID=1178515 RepID=A0A172TK35_9BACL|nr:ABC transporter ATP-binding protein [Paenibacillus swuensis]ANE47425.1 ABC transporter ATP-binding protein [Paenibacillus swuensis]
MNEVKATIPDVITVENVSKSYVTTAVLKDININIRSGEIFGLLGPSGSGKTTLVKLLAGIASATTGEVHVLNSKMPDLSIMSQIGYMSQGDALYHDLSARENLEFFGSIYDLRGEVLSRRINNVMSLVDLTAHLNRPVHLFSGGMKRRLSLAITLLHEPEFLILDEPTVGIDPILRKSIWNRLKELCLSGTTLLITTHVMDEAEQCHRVGMIRDGRLLAVGTPEELRNTAQSDTIEEAFIHYGGIRHEN